MKSLAVAFLFISSASAADLAGRWMNTTDGSLIRFLRVDGSIRQQSSQRFTYPGERTAYSIDQSVIFPDTGSDRLEGSVDFRDSRGCTFKALPVIAEFQSDDTVNVLMTVPRYKFQTITSRENGRPRVSHACRVLEYVEVPVELIRY